jgi:hypothetical protein
VAWKLNGANDYIVWATDSSGNFLSYVLPETAGNNTALEALETTFHQDLNGDGTIGIRPAPALSGSAMMLAAGNDNFVFRPNLGAASTVTTVDNFGSHELPTGDPNITWLVNEAYHDYWQFAPSTFDEPVLSGDHHHRAAVASVHIADLHASHFIIQ